MSHGKFLRQGDDLHNAGVIPQIKKGNSAMNPMEGNPSAEPDSLAHVFILHLSTSICPVNPLQTWGFGLGFRNYGKFRSSKIKFARA
jgi:hypothetical protein